MKRLTQAWNIIALFVLYPFIAFASDSSLEVRIEVEQEMGMAYYSLAIELDPTSDMGNSLGGLGYGENICAIVGELLGVDSDILRTLVFDAPELSATSDAGELMVYSYILDSWVAAARNALTLTAQQRQSLWNLQCVGSFGIPVDARLTKNAPSDFSVRGEELYIYGDIDPGFFDRFIDFLDENPQARTILLGSAGGSVQDALLTGYEIRMRGLNTVLFGPCLSACPLVYAAGVHRAVMSGPGPHFGFHQIYDQSGPVPRQHEIYLHVNEYLSLMGVEAQVVIDWMMRADPSQMHYPDAMEFCKSRLVIWFQRTCWSD